MSDPVVAHDKAAMRGEFKELVHQTVPDGKSPLMLVTANGWCPRRCLGVSRLGE